MPCAAADGRTHEGGARSPPLHQLGAAFLIHRPGLTFQPVSSFSGAFLLLHPLAESRKGCSPHGGCKRAPLFLQAGSPAWFSSLWHKRSGMRFSSPVTLSRWQGRLETALGFKDYVARPGVHCDSSRSGWKMCTPAQAPSSGVENAASGVGSQAGCLARSPQGCTRSQVPFCCWATTTLPPPRQRDGKQLQQRADTTSSSPSAGEKRGALVLPHAAGLLPGSATLSPIHPRASQQCVLQPGQAPFGRLRAL